MPDEVAILRSQAAKLNDAARILSVRGHARLAQKLRVIAGDLILEAETTPTLEDHGRQRPVPPRGQGNH